MKTLLYGSYGNGNIGEEAVLEAILVRIGRKDTTVASGNPFLTKITHGVDAVSPASCLPNIYKYDRIIVGGCGIFYGDTALPYANMIVEGNRHGKNTEIFNVGIGPIANDVTFSMVKLAFEVANRISVRTEFAKVILQEAMGITRPIPVYKDVSCELDVPSCHCLLESIYGSGRYIGVSLKNTPGSYFGMLDYYIKQYIGKGYAVVPIFNSWTSYDGARRDAVGIRMLSIRLGREFNFWKSVLLPPKITMGIVKCMDRVVSMTVHSNIWARHFNVPSTAFVPNNPFHPMAFKQLGATDVVYSTPPGWKENNHLFIKWKGIDWSTL
jgi:hypothetical protein